MAEGSRCNLNCCTHYHSGQNHSNSEEEILIHNYNGHIEIKIVLNDEYNPENITVQLKGRTLQVTADQNLSSYMYTKIFEDVSQDGHLAWKLNGKILKIYITDKKNQFKASSQSSVSTSSSSSGSGCAHSYGSTRTQISLSTSRSPGNDRSGNQKRNNN